MRRHGAGDAPGGGKRERQQDHGPIDRNVRFDRRFRRRFRPLYRRQHQEVDRQANQHMRGRPSKAGVAPTDALQSPGRQRPSDCGGKTRDQGNAGDRATRGIAVDTAKRAKGRVVKAKSHADAEQQPGCN